MGRSADLEARFGPGWYNAIPLELSRGRGAVLWDADGRELVDCFSGHAVVNAGHCPERVVEAICRQARTLINCYPTVAHEERAKLHEKLAEVTPPHLVRSFLCNSGTEAVECALKVALARKRNVKQPEVVAFKRAFHGRTLGSLSLTFNPAYRRPFEGFTSARVRFATFGDAASVRQLVNDNTVAVFMEVVQGEGGVHVAPRGFPEAVEEVCRERDLAFVVDEVQTGFGRTGEMFAFQHHGVEPDLICVAKGIASGVPMGACVGREEFFAALKPKEHASTFGGNPLACAAANATIRTIEEEGLVENARVVGRRLLEGFQRMAEDGNHSVIRDVRGLGLMMGVECRTRVGKFLQAALERGVLALTAGAATIRLLPPLCLSAEQAEFVLSVFDDLLRDGG
ncbi:MAG: aspartate aminotransferase family protein [Promethearchaeota archaeon]